MAEGDSVTLHTNVTKLHKDDVIQWWYEDEDDKNLIAKIDKVKKNKPDVYDGADGRFRSKLVLDGQTGNLTIKDIRTIHSGLYKLKISSGKRTKYMTIFVPVTGEYSIPVC